MILIYYPNTSNHKQPFQKEEGIALQLIKLIKCYKILNKSYNIRTFTLIIILFLVFRRYN